MKIHLLSTLVFSLLISLSAHADEGNSANGPQNGASESAMNSNGVNRQRPPMPPEMREKLKAMTPEERQAFIQKMRERRANEQHHRNSNPPSQAGGPGADRENPPGPAGDPGASPDRRPRMSPEMKEKLQSMTPDQRKEFFHDARERRAKNRQDHGNNPPGKAGGPGTDWENPPGPAGGPGASPDRHPRENHQNAPGKAEGRRL